MAIVYLHRRLDNNEVFYIGIGKSEKRAYCTYKRNKYWYNATNKYDYIVEITHNDLIWEEACSIEKYLISFWKENGKSKICNLTYGGEGTLGFKLSDESLKKLKSTQKLRLSDKTKHPMFGKKHSLESIIKNSSSQKGEKSPLFGVYGKNHPRFGTKISVSQKNKIIESNKKRAKLSKTQIDYILKNYVPRKLSCYYFAKLYDVSYSIIYNVIKNNKNEIINCIT